MASIKPEDAESSLWQGYSLHTPTSTSNQLPPFDPNYTPGPLQHPYHARPQPQKGNYRSLDIPSMQTRPPPRDGTGILTASPPSLNSHHSFPSLKRSYAEDSPYGEVVQDYREEIPEIPKPSINQDHRLLSFSKLQDKQTIVDNHGRVQQLDLSAQIHGMFFLSEMTTPSSEGMLVQPELTCYRRNLFQISGTVTAPRGSLSVINERGERVPIISMDVTISASESVDGHSVKLIVIPWKTPPPNSPEVGPGQEHEPTPLPLQPFDESGPDVNSDFSVYPIAYRRLQFRIATANNGRRRELQQHFTLHLNVQATLANGAKVNICETQTAPIVVRGRSPRNFQARKEIPLVGSSSSRGGPPELHVATSVGSGKGPISAPVGPKPNMAMPKPQTMELPRSPFNFDASGLPPSPALMRTSTYPTYMPSHQHEHAQSTGTTTPGFQAPVALDSYLQSSHPGSDASQAHNQSRSQAPQQQQQYTYLPPTSSPAQLAAPIKFVDSNPRPSKSPRHAAAPERQTSVHESSYPDYGSTRFAPSYSGPGDVLPPRDPGYFPTPLPLHQQQQQQQPWTSNADTSGVYGTTIQAPSNQSNHHYQFPNEHYGKVESNQHQQQQNYNWNPS